MQNNQYANALFEIARDDKALDQAKDAFDLFMNLLTEEVDFAKVLRSPKVNINDKKNLVKRVLSQSYEDFRFFVCVVLDNGRFEEMTNIYQAFCELYNEEKKLKIVEIKTASKLDLKEEERLIAVLEKLFMGYQVQINAKVVPDLVAGYSVYADGKCIDLSVQSQMEQLKSMM